MNMNINASTGIGAGPQIVQKQQDKPECVDCPEVPGDRVEQGPPQHGWGFKAVKVMAQGIGGLVGLAPGAAYGAVKGAATEQTHELAGPKVVKVLRAFGAGAGLVIGGIAGMSGGPMGLAAGIALGPILGSALMQALPGALDGAYAAAKGGGEGAMAGAKKGAEYAGRFVEWVASKIPHKPEETPAPPAPEQPPAPPAPEAPKPPQAPA